MVVGSDSLRVRAAKLLDHTTFIPRLPDDVPLADDFPAGASPRRRYDVILAPHTLWHHKTDVARKHLVETLWALLNPEGGVVVFLEKGTPRGFEAVAGARAHLLANLIEHPTRETPRRRGAAAAGRGGGGRRGAPAPEEGRRHARRALHQPRRLPAVPRPRRSAEPPRRVRVRAALHPPTVPAAHPAWEAAQPRRRQLQLRRRAEGRGRAEGGPADGRPGDDARLLRLRPGPARQRRGPAAARRGAGGHGRASGLLGDPRAAAAAAAARLGGRRRPRAQPASRCRA